MEAEGICSWGDWRSGGWKDEELPAPPRKAFLCLAHLCLYPEPLACGLMTSNVVDNKLLSD